MTAPTTTEVRERTTWTGQSLPRKEDRRLLQGQGSFVDDRGMHRMGYAHFVRSPHAHAVIKSVDTSKAEALPGVITTLTGEEVKAMTEPLFQFAPRESGEQVTEYLITPDKVRYQGEAVALVLAETRDVARDAADLVEVEYEPLPVVVDAVEAEKDSAPVLHESLGDNLAWHGVYSYGDIDWALQEADHVVKIDRLHFHRFSSTPLELNGALVEWDPGTDIITVVSNNQFPLFGALVIGPSMKVGIDQFHFVSQDIGGGFGIKINSYQQIGALALLSRKAGVPVKWTEYRTEHHLSAGHGSERTFLDIQVPVMEDGTILGFKVRAYDDAGAYLHYEPLGAVIWSQVTPGCYKSKHIEVDYKEFLTNKAPSVPNRGYSRLQHLWMIERVVDIVANELGFDPVELRKKNYVQPEDYPYETPNGCVYDSGDLPRSLDMALEMINYAEWRKHQEQAKGTGKRIGIGIGTTLDSGTNNFGQSRILNPNLPFSGNGEACTAKLDLYGEIVLQLGTTPQGQGHETTFAQIVAEELGIPASDIQIEEGDTDTAPYGLGTYASRSTPVAGAAAAVAARKIRDKARKLAAHLLEAAEADLVWEPGKFAVRGAPNRAVTIQQIALAAYTNHPQGMEAGLEAVSYYDPPNLTFPFGSYICVVDIDKGTGQVAVRRFVAVDDCGNIINPMIVEGQIHGGLTMGLAPALYEEISYDEIGNVQGGSFIDYLVPTAVETPRWETDKTCTPSPHHPLGAKGVGESATVGAPAAIANAVVDALWHLGVRHVDIPITPPKVWALLKAAVPSVSTFLRAALRLVWRREGWPMGEMGFAQWRRLDSMK